MKLLSLSIEQFAGLKERVIPFADGVNLFYGDNEAGKSSICECLLFVLYGFADKKQRLRFCPWDGDYAAAALTVQGEDGIDYRIERRVTREGADTHRIVSLASGKECFENQAPADVFMQIPLPLYRRSAFVGQTDGARIEGRPIADCMESLLLTADETVDLSHALKQLDDARIPLLYKRQNGGKIFDLRREIEEKEAQLVRAQQSQQQLLQTEHDVLRQQAELDRLQARIAEQEALLAFYEEGKRRSALIQLNTKKERAAQSAQELAVMEQTHAHNGFFPDRAYIARLEALRAPLEQATARRQSLGDQCEALRAQLVSTDVDSDGLARSHAHTKRAVIGHGIATILSFLLAVYLLLSSLWSLSDTKKAYVAFGAFLVSLLVFLFFLWKCKKHRAGLLALYRTWQCEDEPSFLALLQTLRQSAQVRRERQNEYNRLWLQYQDAIAVHDEISAQARTELARWGKTDLPDAIERANELLLQHLSLSHKAELAASELQGYQILLAVSPEEVERFHNSPYDFSRYESCNGDAIKTELTLLHQQKDTVRAELQASTQTAAVLRATLTDPAQLQERITHLRAEAAHLLEVHDAFVLAHTALTQARNNIHDGLSPRLTEQAGQYLCRFTQGRYENLQVSKDLSLEYSKKAGERTHSEEFLSAATQDAAYLSLRLALAATFFRRPLPIIFDESFSRMDDDRYTGAISLLHEVCSGAEFGQILIFTSQKRDVRIAEKILEHKAHKL